MAKIVFVHGMRMQGRDGGVLRAGWARALLRGLAASSWGKANPDRLPRAADVDLVYWGNLFNPPDATHPLAVMKGAALEDLRDAYYSLLRLSVRAADKLSVWDAEGRPLGPVAMMVNRLVYQSAVYMQNGPIPNPDHASDRDQGAFFQVQARFAAVLKPDTRVVIAHSLGSVIAYEGLCANPHAVDTLITVGSPLGTPHLILEPLRERLWRRLNHPRHRTLLWPGVRQWMNVYAPADVWCVPIQRLAPLFTDINGRLHGNIRDVQVRHGNPHDFVRTHKLTTYLRHREIHDEVTDALQAVAADEEVDLAACG